MSEFAIDPRFIVELKGRPYPTWPGILDAATKAGLRSLTTRIIQAPSPENGHMAIVQARAEFEDGRVFEDLGDANPANCSAMIATAAIRMASTRAKGRALRDAVNCGMTMLEELPDGANGSGDGDDLARAPTAGGAPREDRPRRAPAAGNGAGVRDAAGAGVGAARKPEQITCAIDGCGKVLTPAQVTMSRHKVQMDVCPAHVKALQTGK